MTLRLTLIRQTDKARLYKFGDGSTTWIPRSVCKSTVKFPSKGLDADVTNTEEMHEVNVEDWWWDKYIKEVEE